MSTFGPIVATAAILFAAFLTLALGMSTKFFTAYPPRGADAMGLAAVFFGMAARWGCLALAALITAGLGGFAWISPETGRALGIVLLACVGLGVVFAASWLQWTSSPKWYTPWAGNLGAILLPAVFMAYLLALLWSVPLQISTQGWPRAVGLGLSPFVAIGLVVGGVLLVGVAQRKIARTRVKLAELDADAAEYQRRNSLSHRERLAEDLAKMPSGSVFWQIAGYFNDCENDDERRMVVQRIQELVKDPAELGSNLGCPYASYRHRAALYVQFSENVHPGYAAHIAAAMGLLAKQVRECQSLDTGDGDAGEYVRGLIGAARSFDRARVDWTQYLEPMKDVRSAIEAVPASDARSKTLAIIDEFVADATEPVPTTGATNP